LNNCAITDNTRSGIYNKNSSPVLTSCTISNNDGSGMYNNNSSPNLDHCIFTGNKYSGMHNYSSSPTLTNCTFAHNTYDYGGGMSNSYSSPVLSNCIFWANSATGGGGGIYNLLSTTSMTNCTFSGNSAPIGGAMYNNSGWIALTNSIFWGDSSEIFSDLEYTTIGVTYSDVMGGHVGEGNLDLDPLFVDAANGDFHLSAGSPVIDMGSGAALVVDFEGDPRILDGNGDGVAIVDMGVDEYNPESSARSGGALKLIAGQQPDKVGLARLSWQPVAILAVAGFYAAMPDHVRKYSARNIPR
jgi:parallel beta-helix repeat protein